MCIKYAYLCVNMHKYGPMGPWAGAHGPWAHGPRAGAGWTMYQGAGPGPMGPWPMGPGPWAHIYAYLRINMHILCIFMRKICICMHNYA